jgi:hypothetical protein
MRCHHEASLHIFNSFITLTYDPEHLPEDGSLNVGLELENNKPQFNKAVYLKEI